MAAFSSSRFFESAAPVRRVPTPSIARTPHRKTDVVEIAARVRAAVAEAALFSWTVLVVGFLLLVMIGCFL
jgi:hypothetical protein